MSNIYSKAKWIWADNSFNKDDYASFKISFVSTKKHLQLYISCDCIYAIYLNDKLVKFMMCSDYPYYKYYDIVDLDINCLENNLRIDVWHYGEQFQTYFNALHGLIFELKDNEQIIAYSNKATPSRIMHEFHNGLCKKITTQLGYSFSYDATKEISNYSNSILVDKPHNFIYRNIHNIVLLDRPNITIHKNLNSYVIDMQKEIVGLPDLEFISNKKQKIIIAFGEHLVDGHVLDKINERDFTFEYIAKSGKNIFLNPLRRLGARYFEVFYEDNIKIEFIGLRAVKYEHEIIAKHFADPLLDKIYQTCIYTLECSMHEHYEDCPWREQALYNLDSRNQMLCGYYVFKGYEFQKHNLLLINKDRTKSGLLNLCFPMDDNGLAIPMFSLFYIIQVYEYVKHTNDKAILDELKPTLKRIKDVFASHLDKNNLIPYFDKPFWNFYEWTLGSANDDVFLSSSPVHKNQYDLIINAMFVYSMKMYEELFSEQLHLDKTVIAINDMFFDKKKHLFKMNSNADNYSQFGNALAMLIGLGDGITAKKLKTSEDMVEASLSVRGFIYDALLKKDKSNLQFVIDDIKKRYKKMLDDGATTFYETELGWKDFSNAGSLCHGWSALPIYYLNLL